MRSLLVVLAAGLALPAFADLASSRRSVVRLALEGEAGSARSAARVPAATEPPLRDRAMAVLARNAALLAVDDPRSEMHEAALVRDRRGGEHLVFDRLVAGLPLEGARVRVHAAPGGSLRSLRAGVVELTPADRLRIEQLVASPRPARGDVRGRTLEELARLEGSVTGIARLVLTESAVAGPPFVAWTADVTATGGSRWRIRLDGATGDVIESRRLDVHATPSIGTGIGTSGELVTHLDTAADPTSYRLEDLSRRAGHDVHGHGGLLRAGESLVTLDGRFGSISSFEDWDDAWDDPDQAAAVDAHRHAALVYDWMLAALGLNGPDGDGSGMTSLLGRCDRNAFWNGSYVEYCEGNWPSLAGALDIVGHEWAHAVTDLAAWPARAGLDYVGESGALSEAFSDWMGTACEHAHGEENWTVGEPSFLIRDLSDPPAFGQPQVYLTDPAWIPVPGCVPDEDNDVCGVHVNSGVANKAFYLICRGGTFRDVVVRGLGIEQAILIALDANLAWWPEDATFMDGRDGMVEAARASSFAAGVSARNAWAAVGVGEAHVARSSAPADVAPAEAPDGFVTREDVARLVLLALAREETPPALLARADVAPFTTAPGDPPLAQPEGDDRVTVADAVFAAATSLGILAVP